MERKFIIDKTEVCIPEDKIKIYYKVFDDCYHNHQEVLQKYDGDLYVSEDGNIIDCADCSKEIKSNFYNKEGLRIEFHNDYFTIEKSEGFVYNNKLFLLSMIEEVH